MALRFFTIPVQSSETAETELNAFLAGHRVLAVERQWVDLGVNSFWALCVDYLPAGGAGPGMKSVSPRNRIDYKEVLSTEEFSVFSQLRDIRKQISQVEAVPVYTVFTNEQLAQAVQLRCRTKADLARIEGIGEVRIEKYADHILPLLSRLPESDDAASRPPI